MKFKKIIRTALTTTWHQQPANASLERWLQLCEDENWGNIPDKIHLIAQIFGSSWYFTRYIFYRGHEAAAIIDNADAQGLERQQIIDRFKSIKGSPDLEQQLDRLRVLKNELMLQILVCYISEQFNQQQTEQALTRLAEATLMAMMSVLNVDSESGEWCIAVLGMGRMAGGEMTFGSDLDLIFLYEEKSDEVSSALSRNIRLLLRILSSATPAGSLYDVDMRLRPHGTSGALLTSTNSFLQYHQSEREIWERQMMTRCRPVFDENDLGHAVLQKIIPNIYAEYDEKYLRNEIASMRARVQEEKGRPSGKFEVKRGKGGIMDIDFITHFLQLRHGYQNPDLQTGSTRTALSALRNQNIISSEIAEILLDAYDFLKKIETCIRLFDMKPISAFATDPAGHEPVARAMGFFENNNEFLDKYISVTESVRKSFIEIVGDPN